MKRIFSIIIVSILIQAGIASGGERYIISTEGVNFSRTGSLLAKSASSRLKVIHSLKNLQFYVVEVEKWRFHPVLFLE